MSDGLLVINAGSSSVKFSVFETGPTGGLERVCRGLIEGLGGGTAGHFSAVDGHGVTLLAGHPRGKAAYDHATALEDLLIWLDSSPDLPDIVAVGHRVVHGGVHYSAPRRVDAGVMERLEALVPLAPLHQPHNLAPIRALAAARPTLPQVACFDTAFHHTQPAVARRFALPRRYWEAGVQRYGFHGLSYEYIASVLPAHVGEAARGRVVVAHLGNGASLCALRELRSVATTMGFTALEGLPMGTRCGAIDPGVLLYLMEAEGMDAGALADLLYRRSGLLGLSGLSNDMRTLLASDEIGAREAVAYFVYRIGRELGALAATVGGLDVLVFTAGIGEHAVPVRQAVCEQAAWLGVRLDAQANARHGPRISTPDSPVTVLVIPTDEDRMIAGHVYGAVSGAVK